MLEWLRAGYFPGDLMVRRTLDKRFVSLHEMTLLHGGAIPFLSGVGVTSPPPLESLAEVAAAAEHARAMQQQQMLLEQMRQQMLVQQLAQRNLMQVSTRIYSNASLIYSSDQTSFLSFAAL
jgi:hypothetical protein